MKPDPSTAAFAINMAVHANPAVPAFHLVDFSEHYARSIGLSFREEIERAAYTCAVKFAEEVQS